MEAYDPTYILGNEYLEYRRLLQKFLIDLGKSASIFLATSLCAFFMNMIFLLLLSSHGRKLLG